MSLTPQQEDATRNELKQNFELANVTLDQVAADLSATSEHVQNVMQLDADRIEEPWILKLTLIAKLLKQVVSRFLIVHWSVILSTIGF